MKAKLFKISFVNSQAIILSMMPHNKLIKPGNLQLLILHLYFLFICHSVSVMFKNVSFIFS